MVVEQFAKEAMAHRNITAETIWGVPHMGYHQMDGWFIMENLIQVDDLRVYTPISGNLHLFNSIIFILF